MINFSQVLAVKIIVCCVIQTPLVPISSDQRGSTVCNFFNLQSTNHKNWCIEFKIYSINIQTFRLP